MNQPPRDEKISDGLLSDIRKAGWSVACHNDYWMEGSSYTFWLFTHPDGQWVKGEGQSDAEALGAVSAQLAERRAADRPVDERLVEALARGCNEEAHVGGESKPYCPWEKFEEWQRERVRESVRYILTRTGRLGNGLRELPKRMPDEIFYEVTDPRLMALDPEQAHQFWLLMTNHYGTAAPTEAERELHAALAALVSESEAFARAIPPYANSEPLINAQKLLAERNASKEGV